jgi:hypothetical protein
MNKNYILLKKDSFQQYEIFEYGNDDFLNNFEIIFNDPLGLSFVHNFIYEYKEPMSVSCITFHIELTDKNTIVIYSYLSEDKDNPDTIEVDKDILFDFIQRYRKMRDKNPDEIIITREGDNYIIEGKFTDGRNLIM